MAMTHDERLEFGRLQFIEQQAAVLVRDWQEEAKLAKQAGAEAEYRATKFCYETLASVLRAAGPAADPVEAALRTNELLGKQLAAIKAENAEVMSGRHG